MCDLSSAKTRRQARGAYFAILPRIGAFKTGVAMGHSYDEDFCDLTILVGDIPYRDVHHDSFSGLVETNL